MADATELEPALSAEQWARGGVIGNGFRSWAVNEGCIAFEGISGRPPNELPYLVDTRECHALAALCLHGRPFGFTHEDVRELREALEMNHAGILGPRTASLADRIEALLPPKEG
jgi:hypothetical protein